MNQERKLRLLETINATVRDVSRLVQEAAHHGIALSPKTMGILVHDAAMVGLELQAEKKKLESDGRCFHRYNDNGRVCPVCTNITAVLRAEAEEKNGKPRY